jgi:hypothetical protein
MNVALRAFFSCPYCGLRRNDKTFFEGFVEKAVVLG